MKVLTIHYSQSGQLTEIVNNISNGLKSDSINIEHLLIKPKQEFPFPWTKEGFFNAMPESVLNKGCDIEDFETNYDKYDLILLGYQAWFLSPSIPTMGILKNEKVRKLIKDTKVITIIGARNMWINSQKTVKEEIKTAGGQLIGNIPLIDKNNNLISAFTIMHWMFTGKKTKKWGILPKPGVLQSDIDNSTEYGKIIQLNLSGKTKSPLQKDILTKGDVTLHWTIIFIESRAKKLFQFWANVVTNKGNTLKKRKKWLLVYRFYLIFALFIVSPIVLAVYALLFRPFNLNNEKQQKIEILSI